MQCAGKVFRALLLVAAADASRGRNEPTHVNQTALLVKPGKLVVGKPKVVNAKPMLHRTAKSMAHQQARRNMIQQLVAALHQKKNSEFLGNASCGELVAGTIGSLEFTYSKLQVADFFRTVCDDHRIYLEFGGPQTCVAIFNNLVTVYENDPGFSDQDFAKWCTESQGLLAAGPAAAVAAPAAAPSAAGPGGAPGGGWMKPWLAAELDGPSPEFFRTCDEIVQSLLMRNSRGIAKGTTNKMAEYLTIICSVPKTTADESLCNDFKSTFLEHVHPKDHKWNSKTMDSKLFCNGFYKVLVQHVGFYHAVQEGGPAGAPGGAPVAAPAASPAQPPGAF